MNTEPLHETGADLEEDADRLLYIYEIRAKWVNPDGRPDSSVSTFGSATAKTEGELLTRYMTVNANDDPKWKARFKLLSWHVQVTWLCMETWWLHWFGHSTIDQGQTDKEALDSFRRYVNRIQRYNEAWLSGRNLNEPLHAPFCLMGAEDSWRWTGRTDDGEQPEKVRGKPCRCKHCKRLNLIRIDH